MITHIPATYFKTSVGWTAVISVWRNGLNKRMCTYYLIYQYNCRTDPFMSLFASRVSCHLPCLVCKRIIIPLPILPEWVTWVKLGWLRSLPHYKDEFHIAKDTRSILLHHVHDFIIFFWFDISQCSKLIKIMDELPSKVQHFFKIDRERG